MAALLQANKSWATAPRCHTHRSEGKRRNDEWESGWKIHPNNGILLRHSLKQSCSTLDIITITSQPPSAVREKKHVFVFNRKICRRGISHAYATIELFDIIDRPALFDNGNEDIWICSRNTQAAMMLFTNQQSFAKNCVKFQLDRQDCDFTSLSINSLRLFLNVQRLLEVITTAKLGWKPDFVERLVTFLGIKVR